MAGDTSHVELGTCKCALTNANASAVVNSSLGVESSTTGVPVD